MITEMRKELKKLSAVLWVVLGGLIFSSLGLLLFKQKTPRELKVAMVNNEAVYLNEYNSQMLMTQMKIDQIKYYARTQGFSPEVFLSLYGLSNPQKAAFDELVINKLLKRVGENLNIAIQPDYLATQISRSIPPQVLDAKGDVDQRAYREFLNRMHLTISEYEDRLESDLKMNLVRRCISVGSYLPEYVFQADKKSKLQKKSFDILKFDFNDYLNKVKTEKVTDEILKEYFNTNKEAYKVPEKRSAEFWIFSSKDYEKSIVIDNKNIEAFYHKHKDSIFRIPPEINIRKISIKIDKDMDVDKTRELMIMAQNLYKEVLSDPSKFAELAKKHSLDTVSAAKGGETGFFSRGKYNKELEMHAFRLKEKGEIAGPIKTSEGVEIIQLIDRKAAKSKPLLAVRDDIIESLKGKKSLNKLRGELESVKHLMKNDDKAIDKFVAEKGLKASITKLLGLNEIEGYEPADVVLRKLFEKKNKDLWGYVEVEGKYFLYRQTGYKASYTPNLNDIRDKVTADYYNQKAEEVLAKDVSRIKRGILDGKLSMNAIQEAKLSHSGLIGFKDKLMNSEALGIKAFELSSPKQLLSQDVDKDYYLIRLKTAESVQDAEPKKEELLSDRMSDRMLTSGASILSLMRVAQIDRLDESLQNR